MKVELAQERMKKNILWERAGNMLLEEEKKIIRSALNTLDRYKSESWQEGDDFWYEVYLPLQELLEKDEKRFTF